MNTAGSHDKLQPLDKRDSLFMLCVLRQELARCNAFIPTLRETEEDMELLRQSIKAEIDEIEKGLKE